MKDGFGILPRNEVSIGTRGIESLLPDVFLAGDPAAKGKLAEYHLRTFELASPLLIP